MQAAVVGENRSPLDWLAKPVVAIGAILMVIGGIGAQTSDEIKEIFFGADQPEILLWVGVGLAALLAVLALIALFANRPGLNVAVLALAGWPLAFSLLRIGSYVIDSDGAGGVEKPWWGYVTAVGVFVLGLGTLLLVASTSHGLGRLGTIGEAPSGLAVFGRIVLLIGIALALVAVIGLSDEDEVWFAQSSAFAYGIGACAIGVVLALVTIWRSWAFADVAMAMVAGWVAGLALPIIFEAGWWMRFITDDLEWSEAEGALGPEWVVICGVAGWLALAIASILLAVAATKRIRGLDGAGYSAEQAMTAQGGYDTGAATEVPAGWYADPSGSGRQRWWDGYQWTDHLG